MVAKFRELTGGFWNHKPSGNHLPRSGSSWTCCHGDGKTTVWYNVGWRQNSAGFIPHNRTDFSKSGPCSLPNLSDLTSMWTHWTSRFLRIRDMDKRGHFLNYWDAATDPGTSTAGLPDLVITFIQASDWPTGVLWFGWDLPRVGLLCSQQRCRVLRRVFFLNVEGKSQCPHGRGLRMHYSQTPQSVGSVFRTELRIEMLANLWKLQLFFPFSFFNVLKCYIFKNILND